MARILASAKTKHTVGFGEREEIVEFRVDDPPFEKSGDLADLARGPVRRVARCEQ